jgi:hypothetical protein
MLYFFSRKFRYVLYGKVIDFDLHAQLPVVKFGGFITALLFASVIH